MIRVTLRDEPDALRIVIEDDGVGFDPEAVSQRVKRGEHLGLLGMTERVRAAGGSVEVGTTERDTWRIEAALPLRRSAALS